MKRGSNFLRVPYDVMFPIFTALETALVTGEIGHKEFMSQWSDLLEMTGWSDHDIEDEVDRRWSTQVTREESFVC